MQQSVWWDLRLAVEPRELVSTETLESRLVHLGKCSVWPDNFHNVTDPIHDCDAWIYAFEKVPVCVFEVPWKGETTKFVATVRPYNEKEVKVTAQKRSRFIKLFPLSHLNVYFKSCENIDVYFRSDTGEEEHLPRFPLPFHYLPHIRGTFKGIVNDFIFWEPLQGDVAYSEIHDALTKSSKGYFFPYLMNPYFEYTWKTDPFDLLRIQRQYKAMNDLGRRSPFEELSEMGAINSRKPHLVSDYELCNHEEYSQLIDNEQRVVCLFPVRLLNVTYPATFVLSNKGGEQSRIRQPYVLGAYGGMKGRNLRVWTFRNIPAGAKEDLKDSFGLDFKVVTFLGKYKAD